MPFDPKIGDLVYIRWEDHCSYADSAWTPIAQLRRRLSGSMCETVGFVVDLTEDHITTVAHVTVNRDGGEDGSHVATRLRRAIIQGKVIKRFK